jgi:hypothetical protein
MACDVRTLGDVDDDDKDALLSSASLEKSSEFLLDTLMSRTPSSCAKPMTLAEARRLSKLD